MIMRYTVFKRFIKETILLLYNSTLAYKGKVWFNFKAQWQKQCIFAIQHLEFGSICSNIRNGRHGTDAGPDARH